MPTKTRSLPKTEWRTITPDDALEILTRPGKNRPLNKSAVERYKQAILRGAWEANGEAIRIDWNGQLIDGQHRLHAIVEADTPIMLLVVEGLDPSMSLNIDTGNARTPSHFLSMSGEANARMLSVTLKLVERWHAGWASLPQYRRGNDMLQKLLEENPGLRLSVHEASRYRRSYTFRGKVSLSAFAFVHYGAAVTSSAPEASTFLSGVMRGVELRETDPRHVLRQSLIAADIKSTSTTMDYVLARIITAWNLYATARSCKIIRATSIPMFEGEAVMRERNQIRAAQDRLEAQSRDEPEAHAGMDGISARDQELVEIIRAAGADGITSNDIAAEWGLDAGFINVRLKRLRDMGLLAAEKQARGGPGNAPYLYTSLV